MTSWTDIETAAPDLGRRAHAILASTTNAVLATIRRDGSPRLSGIDPFFFDGHLWIGSMPGARKGQDLGRDPRMALHSVPWESRRIRDGVDDPGDGDAKVTGRALAVDDPAELERVLAWFGDDRGLEPPTDADLFRIDPESVVVVSVEGDHLVIDRWTHDHGRETIRRT